MQQKSPDPFFLRIAERAPPELEFEILVQGLGTRLAPERMKQIEADGQIVPEARDLLCKGGQAYVMNIQGDGGPVIHVADGRQIAFGYAFHALSQAVSDETEKPYLKDFNFAGESKAEVLDENFDTVQMVVKKYASKNKDNIQALAYTHGTNRTLAFFDSSKIDASKLLPSPPSAVGKDTIDKVKAMLKSRSR